MEDYRAQFIDIYNKNVTRPGADPVSYTHLFLTKQDYDLIVLDVNLPDGNVFDFCREVKAVSYTHLDVYKRQHLH